MSHDNAAVTYSEESISIGASNLPDGRYNTFQMPETSQDKDAGKNKKTNIGGKLSRAVRNQCQLGDSIGLRWTTLILSLVLCWVLLYLVARDEALPPGGLFNIIFLLLLASLVGGLVAFVGLPALLGMLLTGIALKSTQVYQIDGVYEKFVLISRDVALTVILIKAGLGLDPRALRKHCFTVLKLSLAPCLTEAVAAAVAAHLIFGLPWLWGFLLGFLLSPISPAVVVPTLLALKEKGYGEDKGIATLVIAASSIDDIFSISLFGVFLSLIFSGSSELTMQIIRGPLEVVAGIAVGIFWGLVCAFFPHRNDVNRVAKRSVLVGVGGLILVLGSKEVNLAGAGPLAAITSTFTASIAWSLQHEACDSSTIIDGKVEVGKVFSNLWLVMQPILFALIGAEIDVTQLMVDNLKFALIILAICLSIRIVTCILILLGSSLTWKECFFVNLAWLPKATVQAALSPAALQLARERSTVEEVEIVWGELLLTTAVIAILVTAPLGSLGISIGGRRLLTRVQTGLLSSPAST